MKRTIKLWEIALLIGCLLTLLFGNLFQAEKTVSDLQQHVLLPVYTAFPFHSLTTQKLFKETLMAQS